MIRTLKKAVRRRLVGIVDARLGERVDDIAQIASQLVQSAAAPCHQRLSAHDSTKVPSDSVFREVAGELVASGVTVCETTVDLEGFRHFLSSFPEMQQYYAELGDVCVEKCLEHYLTFQFLGLAADQTHMDVAAAGSSWASMLRRRRVRSYRLDLAFSAGLRGWDIGADAGDTGLPADFADGLSLHCAFECFSGDADMRFVDEARRILKPGGGVAIVPLYVDRTYFVSTSPYCDQREVVIDVGAEKLWRDDEYKVPFSRHYSPHSFLERVWERMEHWSEKKVLHFTNLHAVRRAYPGQRIYCYFMLVARK